MLQIERKVREVSAADWPVRREEIVAAGEPLLLKGLVADWPAVRAGLQSVEAGADHLRAFYRDATVGAWIGGPEIGGRFFYNADLTGFNYQPMMVKLEKVFDRLLQHRHDAAPPAIYVGSTTVDTCLPGFREHNDIDLGARRALASIWIGNRTRVAAHYDVPDNVACVVAGRRRFTLFPPGELRNLYVGPLHLTPAGQPISLVDFAAPDLERFPRFADALRNVSVAELAPGDALLLYTDGATELFDREEHELGKEGLLQLARAQVGDGSIAGFHLDRLEAQLLTGESEIEAALRRLQELTRLPVVKADRDGAYALQDGELLHCSALAVEPLDTTGAGDCFGAGFIKAWLEGRTLEDCLRWGNVLGGLSTLGHGGTGQVVRCEDVLPRLGELRCTRSRLRP